MKTSDALRITREKLDEHDLQHVEVEINARLTNAFGRYKWDRLGTGRRVIQLSKKLVELNDETRVTRTILHEIAHALTEGHHHDWLWKETCLRIGGDGIARYSVIDTNVPKRIRSSKIYTLECAKCGYEGKRRYRRKMTGYMHTGCGGNLNNIELE